MALGSCGHRITHQLRPINMNGRSILSETSIKDFQRQVGEFQKQGVNAGLAQKDLDSMKREMDSLNGSLARLMEQSYREAVNKFLDKLSSPAAIKGQDARKFLNECIDVRNTIAHNAVIGPSIDLAGMAEGLRHFVLSMIWTLNHIPNVSVEVPASTISFQPGAMRIKAI
jgi:hypothetical protein